jgi:hypothetical protein
MKATICVLLTIWGLSQTVAPITAKLLGSVGTVTQTLKAK